MGRIPPYIVDDIIQASRIEEVVGEFVTLKRAGSNLKGLSPFTDEKTPSFSVSPSKQIFKCFSTGKGGNVVSFLMEKEHYSYPEALRWLADKYGISVPEDEPLTSEELASITERESLQIINKFAKDYFKNELFNTEEGQNIGLSYFLERGFRKDIIEKFELGYCPNKGDSFSSVALKQGYKKEYLEKVGLIKSNENRVFDFFRGRVMFPIHSITGRVLGFGGRTLLADKKIAKYFNSPESIIYNKSEILYGLFFAKGDIIKYDNCFLVEGYTDVISLHQSGVCNVVSSSGTSLTKDQIKLIRRYTSNITILYDGDAAGIKASFRGIDMILAEDMNVKVVLFPDGEDPDSYSKKVGSSELEIYIKENTKDFLTFKAELLLGDGNVDPSQKVKLVHEIIESISLIPDHISREIYSKEISNRFDLDLNIIQQEVGKIRKKEIQRPVQDTPQQITQSFDKTETKKPEIHDNKIDLVELDLIRILVRYGCCAIEIDQIDEKGETTLVETSVAELIHHEVFKDEMFFENPVCNQIYQIISDGLSQNTLYKSSYFTKIENQEIVKFVSSVESEKYELSYNWLSKYKIDTNTELDKLKLATLSSIYAFKNEKIEQKMKIIRKELGEINENEDFNRVLELLTEQNKLEKIKMAFSKLLNRPIL
jgi:DNA primase